jgi:transcriptional regulator with XRE-family HTH domain
MIMIVKIGEKIKDLRKKADVTQEKFADYLGVSAQAVSKWEVEGCYPDLELLIPIANFFSITIDELMGFDKSKEDEEIKGYMNRLHDMLFKSGNPKEAVAIMREANAKYPGKIKIITELADMLFLYAPTESDEEFRQNAYKEVISLGEKIRDECKDDNIRRRLLKLICSSYKSIGESEKAVKLAKENFHLNFHDSDILVYTQLLDGDELIQQQQTNMADTMNYACQIINTLSKDFAPEARLAIYKNILEMYFTIFKDGDFNFYENYICHYYRQIAEIYITLKDNAKALENLKSAAEHEIAHDKTATNTPYTSPLVNKIKPVYGIYTSGQQGNYVYGFLKSLAADNFNSIRDTPEFKEICENLEKYAVENVYL